jgi:RNA recognition motif-containing protein
MIVLFAPAASFVIHLLPACLYPPFEKVASYHNILKENKLLMRIIVANLDPNLIESDLQRLFTPFGEIGSVEIERDKWNNRSKGRAYIDMPVPKEAMAAAAQLNGSLFSNRSLTVTVDAGW